MNGPGTCVPLCAAIIVGRVGSSILMNLGCTLSFSGNSSLDYRLPEWYMSNHMPVFELFRFQERFYVIWWTGRSVALHRIKILFPLLC